MGWGRYSTRDIERLGLIALVAVVIGLALPAYRKAHAMLASRGADLAWYHHLGLVALCVVATLAGLAALGLLLEGLLTLLARFSVRKAVPPAPGPPGREQGGSAAQRGGRSTPHP